MGDHAGPSLHLRLVSTERKGDFLYGMIDRDPSCPNLRGSSTLDRGAVEQRRDLERASARSGVTDRAEPQRRSACPSRSSSTWINVSGLITLTSLTT